jgi:hypothetical protein
MRTHFKISAILATALLMSTVGVVAQIGEFGAAVPGAVVHSGYALQDRWQNARSPPPPSPPLGTVQGHKPRHIEAREAVKHHDK